MTGEPVSFGHSSLYSELILVGDLNFGLSEWSVEMWGLLAHSGGKKEASPWRRRPKHAKYALISSVLVLPLSGKLLLISSHLEDLCWHPSHVPILLQVVFIRQHTCNRSLLLSDRTAFPQSIPIHIKQLNVPQVLGDCFSKWNCSLQDYEVVRDTSASNLLSNWVSA